MLLHCLGGSYFREPFIPRYEHQRSRRYIVRNRAIVLSDEFPRSLAAGLTPHSLPVSKCSKLNIGLRVPEFSARLVLPGVHETTKQTIMPLGAPYSFFVISRHYMLSAGMESVTSCWNEFAGHRGQL